MSEVNVLVIGVFDMFHVGHLNLLECAKKYGERLIVAVNSDNLTKGYKRMPVIREAGRVRIVGAMSVVDEAFIANSLDIKAYIEEYDINIIVHGDDWDREGYLRQICLTEDYLEQNNLELVFIPYTKDVSSSILIEKIKGN